jgi:hypothetical protein
MRLLVVSLLAFAFALAAAGCEDKPPKPKTAAAELRHG